VAALRFLRALGPERVYGRIHQLARSVYERARALPKVELLTPNDDRMFAGMVTLRFPGADVTPVLKLAEKRRIWLLGGGERFRISTHIHTRPADLDAFFETVREGLGLQA
jgi:selenocysteine lyase/cysteine desulfurase